MKSIICADYFTGDEISGGVQTLFSSFESWKEVECINVSSQYASRVCGIPLVGDFHSCGGRAISEYLHARTRIYRTDLVIQNSIVPKLRKYFCPTVAMINDNNISGPDICLWHRVLDYGAYDTLRNKLLGFQISTCLSSEYVVSVSESVRRDYYEELGIDSKVISPGIDTSLMLKKDENFTRKIREELGIEKDKKTAVVIARFHPLKGWDIASEVIRNNRDINWIVVSDDRRFRTRRDNVRCIISPRRDELMRLYIASDFLMNTSRYESFSLSALEAMACDVPIIMYKTGICDGKAGPTDFGIVVDEYKYDDFNNAIEEFYASSYVFKPRRHVEMYYGIERWRKGWIEIFSQL